MKNLVCDGGCEQHEGKVVEVHVSSWGKFHYCQEAIAEDKRRGLFVTIVENDEAEGEAK